MAKRNYYEVLGVPEDADPGTIKRAFRHLAFQYHPDRNKAPDAEERFKEIAEAYAVLSDPQKRAAYDAAGHAGVAGYTAEDLFGGLDLESIFGRFGGLGGDDLFERVFGRRARGPERGGHLEVDLVVPLERVLRGGKETVHVRRPTVCPVCHGTGARPGTAPKTCSRCGGSGRLVRRRQEGGVVLQQVTTCPDCGGRGRVVEAPCPECGGRGQVAREEAIRVTIPAGIEDGMALRVAGHGLPSPLPGGPPGDLYVVVRSAPDPRFERHGGDLWTTTSIEVADAALGTTIEVPTLEGKAALEVPAGTQPDATFRLAGEGLPAFGGGPRGDLWVRLRVHVPERLSPEQRRLYEALRGHPAVRRRPHQPATEGRRRSGLKSALSAAWQSLTGPGTG